MSPIAGRYQTRNTRRRFVMHIVDLMSKRLMVRVTALVRMTRALTLVALLGGSVAGCPDGGVNITTPANPCGTGTRLVKGACLLLFDGVYIGPFSGTKTIVGFNGSTNVSATLNLTVTNGSLIRAAFDGVPFAENVGVTNSGPGISNTLRSEEHTSELQSRQYLVCRLLLEKKKKRISCEVELVVRLAVTANAG